MKSLLVEAMRQAQSSDKTLTDSGSFDALTTEFANTANDSGSDGPATARAGLHGTAKADQQAPEFDAANEQLALMETVNDLSPNISDRDDAGEADVRHDSHDKTVARTGVAPLWLTMTPAMCLIAAFGTAIAWLYLPEGSPRANAPGIAFTAPPNAGNTRIGSGDGSNIAFPFIDARQTSESPEGRQ